MSSFNNTNKNNRLTVADALNQLKNVVNDMELFASDLAPEDRDADIETRALYAVKSAVNEYTQIFCDIVIVVNGGIPATARSLIEQFRKDYNVSDNIDRWLSFMLMRNEFIHEYGSADRLNYEIITKFPKCYIGAVALYDFLKDIAVKQDLLAVQVRRRHK
jgi:hypothetical protein